MYSTGGCDGPVAVFEFAVYPGYRNRTDISAVPCPVPVISHHETFILGHCDFRRIGRRTALRNEDAILCTVVVFTKNLTGCSRNDAWPNQLPGELCAIHIDIAIFDCHRITGDCDDAFDPIFTTIIRICKQNHVTPLRVGIPVGIFYSNDVVTRRTQPFGILNHHDACVCDIDTNLNHRRSN